MLAVVEELLALEWLGMAELAVKELMALEEHAGVLVPSVKLGGVN